MAEEVPVAKQTGPAYGVKGAIAVCTLAALLTACATTWHNPQKSPQEAAADEKICSDDAEEVALARAARQRVDYRQRQSTMPGMNRGETPIQMHERVGTEDVFHREFESCMTSKGYTQGKPTP
jgi:hypothetical protein